MEVWRFQSEIGQPHYFALTVNQSGLEHSSRKLPIDWGMEGGGRGCHPTIPPGAHGLTPIRSQPLQVILLPSGVNGGPSHEHIAFGDALDLVSGPPSGQHPAAVQVLITFIIILPL